MKLHILAASLSVISLPLSVSAQLYNVDFKSNDGSMSGAGVLGSAGDIWNVFDANPSTSAEGGPLVDSLGAPTAVSLSYVGAAGGGFGFAGDGGNPTALMDGIAHGVNGGGGSSFAQITFTFTGLAPNSLYDVVAYGARAGQGAGTHFFDTLNGPLLGSTDDSSNDINTGAGAAYTMFQMTTDGAGEFTFFSNFNSGSSAAGPVNGFQVAVVPEPSAFALAGIALVSLLTFRRRNP